MRVNPFSMGTFSNMVMLKENKRSMFLHFVPINDMKDFLTTVHGVFLSPTAGLDVRSCLETWYRKDGKHHAGVVNLVLETDKLDASQVDQLLHKVGKNTLTRKEDVVNRYFSLFEGLQRFFLRIEGNCLYLHDIDSKECILHLSFYDVSMQSLKHLKDFFNVIHDLSEKMGLMLDMQVFIHHGDNFIKSKTILIYKERNTYQFKSVTRKIKELHEFGVVFSESRLDKRFLSSLLLRRWIDEKNMARFSAIDDILDCIDLKGDASKATVSSPPPAAPGDSNPIPVPRAIPVEQEFASRARARFPRGRLVNEHTYMREDIACILVHEHQDPGTGELFSGTSEVSKILLVFAEGGPLDAFHMAFRRPLKDVVEGTLLANL